MEEQDQEAGGQGAAIKGHARVARAGPQASQATCQGARQDGQSIPRRARPLPRGRARGWPRARRAAGERPETAECGRGRGVAATPATSLELWRRGSGPVRARAVASCVQAQRTAWIQRGGPTGQERPQPIFGSSRVADSSLVRTVRQTETTHRASGKRHRATIACSISKEQSSVTVCLQVRPGARCSRPPSASLVPACALDAQLRTSLAGAGWGLCAGAERVTG